MSPCRQCRQPRAPKTPLPSGAAVLRDLERELSCTEIGWQTDPRIAARLLDRVRAEVPEGELEALVARYVAHIARGMRPARALLQALRLRLTGASQGEQMPRSSGVTQPSRIRADPQ